MRSVPIQNLECSGCPIEQLKQITHWLDNSNIYGSLPGVATSVRSNKDGLLESIKGSDGQEQLPINPNTQCEGSTISYQIFYSKALLLIYLYKC